MEIEEKSLFDLIAKMEEWLHGNHLKGSVK